MYTIKHICLVLLVITKAISLSCQPLLQADSFLNAKKYLIALNLYNQALSDSQKLEKIDLGNAYMRKANCLVNLEEFEKAVPDYFYSLKIFEKIDAKERIATCNKNLGNLYFQKSELALSEKYFSKAFTGYIQLGDSIRIVELLNEMALIDKEGGRINEAINKHHTAINNYKSVLSDDLLYEHYLNLGTCYALKQPDSAFIYFFKAESIAKRNSDNISLAATYNNIGLLFRDVGNFKMALLYLNNSYNLNVNQGNNVDLSTICHNLSELYDTLKMYKEAYEFLQKEKKIKEEIYNTEKSKYILELSEKYESDKKDEKIRTQEIENKLKNRNLLLSLSGLVLAAGLAIISFISYRRKQKANKILQAQKEKIELLNKELDSSNQVKTKLFSVISHDLRSPISSLYAYLQLHNRSTGKKDEALMMQSEQLLETLEDLLIWSKSQLHQFVPYIEDINLHDLTDNLINLLHANALQKNLTIVNTIPAAISLRSDLNMFTIILRNILSNAIKFSLSSSFITITAAADEKINISVSNQSGEENTALLNTLQEDKITSDKSGLGITLVKEFVAKLKGEFSYSVNHNMVTASVQLPHFRS
ncbi:hypothetical protein DC498_24930 [Terrimonas sp.]|nr:hypothetical protein DC498_24930 [Terrimonas sp.]